MVASRKGRPRVSTKTLTENAPLVKRPRSPPAAPPSPTTVACGAEKTPEEQGVKVGFYGALTGPTATFALSGRSGATLAVEQINAAGGVLGKPIVLLAEDDRGEASEAASAVSKLITRDHVVALIGEQASSRTLAAAPIAQSYRVPMISPTSTNDRGHEEGRLHLPRVLHRRVPGTSRRRLRAPESQGADGGDPDRRPQRLQRRPRGGVPQELRGPGRPRHERAQVLRGRQRFLGAADRDSPRAPRRPLRARLLHRRRA